LCRARPRRGRDAPGGGAPAQALERDVLREVVGAAARAPVIRGGSSPPAVSLASIAPAEELDVVDVDVGRPALVSVAILVLSVLDAALDRDARSLRKILSERLRALP